MHLIRKDKNCYELSQHSHSTSPWNLFILTQLFLVLYIILLFGALFSRHLWRILNVFILMTAIRVVCKLPMTTSADEIKKLRQWNPISLYYVKRLLVLRPINLILI